MATITVTWISQLNHCLYLVTWLQLLSHESHSSITWLQSLFILAHITTITVTWISQLNHMAKLNVYTWSHDYNYCHMTLTAQSHGYTHCLHLVTWQQLLHMNLTAQSHGYTHCLYLVTWLQLLSHGSHSSITWLHSLFILGHMTTITVTWISHLDHMATLTVYTWSHDYNYHHMDLTSQSHGYTHCLCLVTWLQLLSHNSQPFITWIMISLLFYSWKLVICDSDNLTYNSWSHH